MGSVASPSYGDEELPPPVPPHSSLQLLPPLQRRPLPSLPQSPRRLPSPEFIEQVTPHLLPHDLPLHVAPPPSNARPLPPPPLYVIREEGTAGEDEASTSFMDGLDTSPTSSPSHSLTSPLEGCEPLGTSDSGLPQDVGTQIVGPLDVSPQDVCDQDAIIQDKFPHNVGIQDKDVQDVCHQDASSHNEVPQDISAHVDPQDVEPQVPDIQGEGNQVISENEQDIWSDSVNLRNLSSQDESSQNMDPEEKSSRDVSSTDDRVSVERDTIPKVCGDFIYDLINTVAGINDKTCNESCGAELGDKKGVEYVETDAADAAVDVELISGQTSPCEQTIGNDSSRCDYHSSDSCELVEIGDCSSVKLQQPNGMVIRASSNCESTADGFCFTVNNGESCDVSANQESSKSDDKCNEGAITECEEVDRNTGDVSSNDGVSDGNGHYLITNDALVEASQPADDANKIVDSSSAIVQPSSNDSASVPYRIKEREFSGHDSSEMSFPGSLNDNAGYIFTSNAVGNRNDSSSFSFDDECAIDTVTCENLSGALTNSSSSSSSSDTSSYDAELQDKREHVQSSAMSAKMTEEVFCGGQIHSDNCHHSLECCNDNVTYENDPPKLTGNNSSEPQSDGKILVVSHAQYENNKDVTDAVYIDGHIEGSLPTEPEDHDSRNHDKQLTECYDADCSDENELDKACLYNGGKKCTPVIENVEIAEETRVCNTSAIIGQSYTDESTVRESTKILHTYTEHQTELELKTDCKSYNRLLQHDHGISCSRADNYDAIDELNKDHVTSEDSDAVDGYVNDLNSTSNNFKFKETIDDVMVASNANNMFDEQRSQISFQSTNNIETIEDEEPKCDDGLSSGSFHCGGTNVPIGNNGSCDQLKDPTENECLPTCIEGTVSADPELPDATKNNNVLLGEVQEVTTINAVEVSLIDQVASSQYISKDYTENVSNFNTDVNLSKMELCVTDENMYEQNNISDSENDVTYDGNLSVKSNSEPCKLISYIILNDEASSARYSDCEGLPELANVTDSEVTSDGRSDEILACVSSIHVYSRSSSHETITKTENGCAMTQEAGKSDLLHDSCESRENSDSLSNVSMMRTPTCLEDKSLDKNSSCAVTDTTDANFEVLHASSVDNESIVETISYSLQEESKANVMDKIEHGNVLDLSSPIDNGSQVTSDKIDGFGGTIIYEDCSTVNSELENNGIENCCSNDANIVSRSTDQKTSDNGHSSAKYAIDVMRDKDAIILVSDTKINDDTTENREFEINVESDKIDVPSLEKFSERSVYSSSETHTTDNKAVDCTATEKDLEKLHHHDLIKHEYSNLSQITGDINLEPVCNKPNHVYELSLKCNQSDFMIIKNESPNVVPPSPQSKLPFLKSKMYMNNSDITTQPEKSNRSKWLKSKWFNKGKSLYKGLGMPYSSRSTEFPQLQGFKSEKGSPVSILSINPIFECDSSSSEVSSTYSSCDTIRGSDVTGSLSSSTGSSTIDVASSCSKSSSTSSFSSSSTTRSLTSRNILDKEAARNASGVTADEQMHLLSHMHASHGQKHEKQSSSGGMLKGYDVTSFADTEASATQMLLLLQCSGCGRREDCSIGGTYATCDCESKNSGIKESSDCAEICVKCGKEKGSGDRVYICGICIKNLLKRRLSVTSEESGYSKKLRHHSSLPNLTDDDCVFPVYEDKQLKYWVDPGGNFICYPSEASSVEPLETVDELEICRRSSNLKAFTSESVEVLDDYSPSPILKNHLNEIIHKVSNIAETSDIQNTTMEDRFENRNSEASASVLSSKDQDCKMLRNFQTDDHGHNNLTGSCDKMLQHHAECKQTDSGISLMRESVDSISEIGEYNCATYAFESPSRRGHFRGSVKSSTSSSGSLPDVTVTPPPDSGPSSPSSRPTSGAHKTFSNVKKRLAKTRRRHLSSLIGPDVSPEPSTDRALKVGHHSERRSSLVHLATFGLSKLQSYAHGHSNNNNNNSDKKSDRSKKSNSGQFDYPDVQNMRQGVRHVQVPANNNQSPNVERLLGLDPDLQQHRHNLHHHNQHNINVHGGGHQQSHRVPSNGAIIRSSSNPPPLTHHSIPSQLIPDGGGGTTTHMAGSHHIHHHPPHHTQQQHHHHHHNHHQQQQQILQSHNYHHSQQQHAIMTNPQSTSVNIHVPGGPPTNATHNNSTSHQQQQQQHTETYLPDLVRSVRSRGSVASGTREGGSSDTSSAYSGSDTMCHSVHSLDHEDVDLSGLQESAVDSDEEDLAESMETMMVRDAVRECLEKDPSMRTEDDIKVLLEFTQRLKAFADKTLAVRKAMCQAMVFAVVEKAGTILMNDNEELDSWSVIINGYVEVTYMDQTYQLHLGDSFGIPPTMEKLFHRGVMVSMVDDCQFVCIRQSEYFRILHQGEENTLKIEENGQTVLVMEHRQFEANNRKGHIVIKGTPERLMAQLVEVENYIDPTYVEDFLLTHRTFLESPLIVANKLLQWFENPTLRNLVTRVVLLWVNNHFTDFEMDPVMMNFLEQFEEGLERCKMDGQLRLLDFACAAKARSRTVTLTRPSRDEILHFSILGGYKKKCGIFISKVEKGSKAEEVGLKRGDQILEVNGKSFEHIDHTKALELLRSTCHLAITVKSNLLAFKEMLQTPENSPCPHSRKTSDAGSTHSGGGGSKSSSTASDFASTLNLVNTLASPRAKEANSKAAFMNLKKHWFKDAIKNLLPKNSNVEAGGNSDDSVSSQSSLGGPAFHSHSNPDLTALPYDDNRQEFPEHVLKVYRASDQSAKFLPVNQETTAREVVMLSLQIFNINDPSGSSNYALYEVTVTEEGIRKQKRLPDSLQNLAERIGLSSRYYLKKMDSSQNLVPDEIVNELIKEAQVTFLQLNSVELAIQLTLEDFAIFRQIEPTEYIDDLFNLKSKYGTPALSRFADLVNKEMFWVVTEVCSESNVVKRSKIVKQFIKVARQCKECKNFNSMFNILCGLGHRSVSRLRSTWERVPSKYMRLFHELQDLMDPSRNMSKYRNLIHDDAIQPPCIPFYPVVSKDLRFAHDGNKESCKGLINFETLRMISRYIRDMQNMCSTPYDLVNMVESGGQAVSTAMFSMNQMSAGQQHNTVKRRNKSTTTHDKKKMFEEAQMVRRVKTYLAKLTVTTDEDELEKKSYQCEPGLHQNTNSTTHHSATLNNTNSSTSSTTTTTTSTSSGASTAPSNSAPPSSNPQRRRPHSPTPSTTSSTSSTSHTSDGRNSSKFGAKSPQSMRKMMALAENKTKPYHGPRPSSTSSLGHHSPGPSPRPPRRRPTGALAGELANITTSHLNAASNLVAASNRNNHERSHSDTPAVPVDLSAESSSVTSLSNIRKSLTQGCMNGEGVLSHCDADSGISTHYDGSGSLDGGDSGFAGPPSPPPHHRRYSQQPEYYRRSCTSYQGVHVPPFLNAVPVLPPLPSSYAPLPPPGCPPRRRGTNSTPVAPPPDYSSTQMRLMMGRTMSHDAAVQYYIAPPPSSGAPAVQHRSTSQAEDDDEDAQVSTV